LPVHKQSQKPNPLSTGNLFETLQGAANQSKQRSLKNQAFLEKFPTMLVEISCNSALLERIKNWIFYLKMNRMFESEKSQTTSLSTHSLAPHGAKVW
jgi:hypothetical protein